MSTTIQSSLDVRVMWFGLFVCICMFILLRPTFQLSDYLCASLPALARPPGFRSTHVCSSTMPLPMSPRRCSVGVRVMFGNPQPECMDHTYKLLYLKCDTDTFYRKAEMMYCQHEISLLSRLFYVFVLPVVASTTKCPELCHL